MENLACIVVVITAYCFWACAQYHGRPFTCTPDPAATVEEVKEAIAKPAPSPTKIIVEAMPQAAFQISNVPASITVATDLNPIASMTIRQLKAMASKAKIKRYSTKTKAQLIEALS